MADTQYGLPLLITEFAEAPARSLKRIRLEKGISEGYNESWLQRLVSRYPNVLPIEQIEPALTPAVPICMELPLASGFVDNLFATPDGDLIVGETKLFRNPEARREVVAQIIDYAKDLARLSYEELERAISLAEAPDGSGGHPKTRLYEAVACIREDMNEERFVDAVSRNLERGRFLLLVIGDGIQVGTENIAAFLQQHAGMHFTFGLVELAIFALPSEIGGYLAQPRIVARTKNIDRGVVTMENGRITAKPPVDQPVSEKGVYKRTTISEEKFYEELAANFPLIVSRLKAFIARLEEIGIVTDFGQSSINLRWRADENLAWNLGSIATSGKVWTEVVNWKSDQVGFLHLSQAYLRKLASLVPGAQVKEVTRQANWYVAKGGTYVTIEDLLAHEDGWVEAIQEFMAAVTDALKHE